MNETKKLILIDGNALMHRAYHALPPLTTKKGEVVNAVYGFTSVLLKVIKDLKPDYMICAFDVAGGTFRDKIYKDYKAGRKKPDQEFYDQIPKIKEVVRVLNIPIVEQQGFEADDVIGTLASKLGIKNYELRITIVTGDLDALQLVNKNAEVYTLSKGIKDVIIYDEKAVYKRYGLTPEQIIDFKGLRGDPSDNIPGVNGIGEKGATELLKNFKSIEKLYKAIENNEDANLIKPRIKEKLIAQKNQALMSKKLATIKLDMDIKIDLEKCVWGDYDREKLNELFRELEFYSLMSRVDGNQELGIKNQENKNSIKYITLDTDEKLDKFLVEIKKQKQFVFQSMVDENNKLNGLLFSLRENSAYHIPIVVENKKQGLFDNNFNDDAPHPSPLPRREGARSPFQKGGWGDFGVREILEKLKPILEDESYKKIGYFFKQDLKIFQENNINLKGLDFDILIASYLLDPGKRDYSLDKLIFDYLGDKISTTTPLTPALSRGEREPTPPFAKGAGGILTSEISQEIAQISYFFKLSEKLKSDLEESKINNLFYKIEMPLIKVLSTMETNGIKLDIELLKILSVELKEKIAKLEKKIYQLAGDDSFNINSSKQLSQILFEKMQLPTENIKRTQTGYSVASTELEKLKKENIIIDFISEYKELVKLKNTYVDALPKLINKKTNRLHTTFNQTVTATGRLSSSNPNLQNIPIRTEIGRKIRKAFITEPRRKLLSADYSQIELRIIAMIANDKKMKEIFRKDLDIHTATASEINQVPLEDVTAEMRRSAKALNFGVIYGMGVFGFAQSAGIERDRAKEFIKNYMKKFSDVANYIEKSKEDARKKGYAETLFGRRRYLPELNSSNAMVRNSAERMAINMPIQGTAADIIKIAMIKIEEWIELETKLEKELSSEASELSSFSNFVSNNNIKLLLQVHDELLFSVEEEYLEEATKNIKNIMENKSLEIDGKKIDFSVPIKVDLKVGDNWEEMDGI